MTATTLALFRKSDQKIDQAALEAPPLSSPPVTLGLDNDQVEQYGYSQSLENQGDTETFQLLINKLRTWFEEGCSHDQEDRTRSRTLVSHEASTMTDEARLLRNETIPALKGELKESEIRRLAAQADPDSVEKTVGYDPFRQRLLGGSVLIMSAWLFLFYFLAAHVAWLRNLGSELQGQNGNSVTALFETVFDLSAVLRDLAHHPANILVCVLFPGLFFTIGYVTHLLLEKRQYGWLTPALGVTMGLDFAIAYGITMKLHEARLLTGLTELPWRFGLAFIDVNFYTVLLAGMGTYILWGLPLSFYLEERRKGEHLDNFLTACATEETRLKQEIARQEALATQLDGQVQDKQVIITEIEAVGNPAIFSRSKLERLLDAFVVGWSKGVNALCVRQLEQLDEAKRRAEEEKRSINRAILAQITSYKDALRSDGSYSSRR